MWRVTYQDDLDSGCAYEQLCSSSAEASQLMWRLNQCGIPSNPMISRYSNIQVQDLDDTHFCHECREVVSGEHACKKHPVPEKQWGGQREGAGRKAAGTTYQEGYNAGYQAGLRAVKR